MGLIQRISLLVGLVISAGVCTASEEAVQLEGISIHGNRELPKSLVIVPWKASEQGNASAPSFNNLMSNILSPVDRDVFLRELKYYEAAHAAD